MSYTSKWLQFIKERFDPISYVVMILVFVGAHYTVYTILSNYTVTFNTKDVLYLLPLLFAVFLFFFKLRLFDEVKDMELDTVYHPERPLPRGLLKVKDVLIAIYIIIPLEILLFSFYGIPTLIFSLISTLYSLIMYKEFFIKNWLRAHLTTYAVTHTFVVVLISITIFSALFYEKFTEIPHNVLYFSLAGWFLFNIFEFGRKTYSSREEKECMASYSKIFGKFGAVFLVLIMGILSIIFINNTLLHNASNFLFLWLGIIAIVGFLYATLDKPYLAKNYRLATALYIIFTYGTIIITMV